MYHIISCTISYHIPYHIIYHISYHISSHVSYRIISYTISYHKFILHFDRATAGTFITINPIYLTIQYNNAAKEY